MRELKNKIGNKENIETFYKHFEIDFMTTNHYVDGEIFIVKIKNRDINYVEKICNVDEIRELRELSFDYIKDEIYMDYLGDDVMDYLWEIEDKINILLDYIISESPHFNPKIICGVTYNEADKKISTYESINEHNRLVRFHNEYNKFKEREIIFK